MDSMFSLKPSGREFESRLSQYLLLVFFPKMRQIFFIVFGMYSFANALNIKVNVVMKL